MPRSLLFVALLVVGCNGDPPNTEPNAAENEAFVLMASIGLNTLDDSFVRLDSLAYTVQIVVEELDANANVVASASRTVRRAPSPNGFDMLILASEFSGSLSDSTAFEDRSRPSNPITNVLSEDPAFASVRTRDRYAFEMLPDTTVERQRLHVVQATLHQDQVGKQPIRYARYYLTGTNSLVAVDVLRISESALFSETSRATVWLQWNDVGALLPSTAVSETIIRTPGRAPKHLRLTESVEDITAVE